MRREEILFLTHKQNKGIRAAAERLASESGGRNVTILSQDTPLKIMDIDEAIFNAEQVMRESRWPTIGKSIVPGHAHFPVFRHILSRESRATYYWVVEYDVRFTGVWSDFFNSFSENRCSIIR